MFSILLIFAGFVLLVFVYLCFISPHQVAIRPEAIGGRPQLQFLDAPAITICAKVLNKNFPVNTAIKLSNQRKQSVNSENLRPHFRTAQATIGKTTNHRMALITFRKTAMGQKQSKTCWTVSTTRLSV